MILFTFILPFSVVIAGSSALGEHEDGCGIYPRCEQYGAGVWQILEDCHKYISCTFDTNGKLVQENLECPGDLVYTEEYGECVDYNKAFECKLFKDTPCFGSCPRLYIMSEGYGIEHQERRLGCFRLSGSLFGFLPHYKNMNAQYLSPDGSSSTALIHWLISERFGAMNGGVKNEKYYHLQCPYTGWNSGWQVDKNIGNWVEDNTITLSCYQGDEDITTHGPTSSTSASPTSPSSTTTTVTTPTTASTTTPEPSVCKTEGPNAISDCISEFNCCHKESGNWKVTKCTCDLDFLFSQDFAMCSWPDACWRNELDVSLRASHTCEDNSLCY